MGFEKVKIPSLLKYGIQSDMQRVGRIEDLD